MSTLTAPIAHAVHRAARDHCLAPSRTADRPRGEAVGAELDVAPLSSDEVGPGWPDGTPLWFYVLEEAEHRCYSDRLGLVGGPAIPDVSQPRTGGRQLAFRP
jgi:hypothetical protein